MSSYGNINLEGNLDLNSLFNLSYNFDLLKGVIEALVKANKSTNQNLIEIEEKMAFKDNKMNEMNKEIQKLNVMIVNNIVGKQNSSKKGGSSNDSQTNLNLNLNLNNSAENKKEGEKETDRDIKKESDKDIDSKKDNTDRDREYKKDFTDRDREERVVHEEKHEYQYVYNTTTNNYATTGGSEINNNLTMTTDEEINKLIKKINFLDYQVNNLMGMGKDMNDIRRKVKDHDESLNHHQHSIDDIKKRLDELDNSVKGFDEQFQEINIKLINVEAFGDFFNSKDGEPKSYSNEELNVIIGALDKKLTIKMSYVDDRFRKDGEDILKLKQLEKALELTNKNLGNTNKNVEMNKEQIIVLFAKLEDLKAFNQNLNDLTKGELNDNINKVHKYFEDKFTELNLTLMNFINNPMSKNSSTGINPAFDEAKFKDMQKRITDLEKNFKIFSATINLDIINKEIEKIKEGMEEKSSKEEYKELKDLYNNLLSQINYLKDSVSQVLEDRKITDEIIWLRKKVENLSSNIISMKNNEDSNNNTSQINKAVPLESGKYVEIYTFNDFKNSTMKELDAVNSTINILRSLIDEILLQLNSKANDKDLDALRELLMTKHEELKSACNKKFADKNETNRNIKYLDGQIRHVLEVYMKKAEKSDNWLLAKKPLGGHSCASCEAYIGDLQENNQYVPWNKYPARDGNEKLYRIGNGFSKMLQMINIENNTHLKKPTQSSYDFYKNVASSGELEGSARKKEVNLPRVKSNNSKRNILNMSADDVDINNIDNVEELLQPKIVKIYKKAKEKKIE